LQQCEGFFTFLIYDKSMLKKFNKEKNLLEANKLARAGLFLEAIEIYKAILDKDPNDFHLRFLLGVAYLQSDQFHCAVKELQISLNLSPNLFLANHALGSALFMAEEFEASVEAFDREIAMNPTYADAYCDKAYALNELQRFQESLDTANIARQLDPTYADPYNAIADSLNQMDQYDEAMENALRAIVIDRSKPNYFYSLGNIFLNKGNLLEALNSFNAALELNPRYEEASFNKSLIHLRLMDFEAGWKLYEYRFITYPKESRNKFTTKNFFDKSINSLGRIFIFKEQGIGDQILYASAFHEIDKKDKVIYIEVNEKLLPIFQRSFKNLKFVTEKNYPNSNSYESTFGMASLPHFFRNDINSFNIERDFFLLSDKDKKNIFRQRLLADAPLNKVCGLSWQSKNEKIGKYKNLDLINLKGILELQGITFVSLQYNPPLEELELFQSTHKVSIKNFNELDLFNDIDSLCSLIDACDFVVTISNLNAHVAGALGKKTFLLAPFSRGRLWYWHEKISRSLWYPSVEIFSQTEALEWSLPINQIKEKIIEEISHE
jgi:tetratricopeptide (TPR) repeat protein/ADP-heptose:LPS heptosyltransferase